MDGTGEVWAGERFLGSIGPGDFLGELAALDWGASFATCAWRQSPLSAKGDCWSCPAPPSTGSSVRRRPWTTVSDGRARNACRGWSGLRAMASSANGLPQLVSLAAGGNDRCSQLSLSVIRGRA
jgi:hypothetical protein